MGKAMDIGEIKQWEGQTVVDCDGKRIGTVEDVYLATDSSEAVFAYVKTGMLGRGHCLVPLAGASLSGDHVRVAHQQGQVKGAPHFEPGATLDSGMEQDLARHYDIDLTAPPVGDAPRYESARALRQLQAQAREMTKRADEITELGAAIQLARDRLPQVHDDHQAAHKPQDQPRRQQPPIP
jgi:sporulation protein YlmC with PRC-barrel domain